MSGLRRIPWARVLTEGVVIVASILLALGMDAWWSERDADREAHRELAVVLVELHEARAEIELMGFWHDRLGHGMASLAEALEAGRQALVVVDDTVLAGAVLFPVTDPPLTILEAFLGSGHLERLGDTKLRRRLAAWRAQVDDQRNDEFRARNFEDSEFAPYLRTEVEMAIAQNAATSLWLAGRDSVPPGVGEPVRLPSNRRLENLVARQVAWYRLTSSQSRAVLADLDALLELITAELEGE